MNHINLKRKLVGLWSHCRKHLIELNKLQRYKLLKLNKRDIYRPILDTFFISIVSTYTSII